MKVILKRSVPIVVIIAIVHIVICWLAADNRLPIRDEPLYLTIPYRVMNGDRLFVDEWHISQLSAFFLYPILKAYLTLTKSTEGIILSFRYIYMAVQLAVTVMGYMLLEKRGRKEALIGSLMFGIFIPYSIMALSYNTVGLMMVYLITCLNLYEAKHTRLKYFAIGVLLAVAVLCCPYLVILYIAQVLGTIVTRGKRYECFGVRAIIAVTAGAGIIVVMFCAFVFSRASLREVISSIPYILSDPSHQVGGISGWLKPFLKLKYIALIAVGAVFLANGIKFRKYNALHFAAVTAAAVLMLVYLRNAYNLITIPFTIIGFTAFIFTERRDWEMFWKGFLTAVIYAVCLTTSSNVRLYAVGAACMVACVYSVFFVSTYLKEKCGENKKMYTAAFCIVVGIQLAVGVYVDISSFYTDANGAIVAEGPLKGLKTSYEKWDKHEIDYQNVKSIEDYKGKNVLIFKDFVEGNLMLKGARNVSCTSGMWDICSDLDGKMIGRYYELHHDKVPDIIYVDTLNSGTWNDAEWETYADRNGFQIKKYERGGILLTK